MFPACIHSSISSGVTGRTTLACICAYAARRHSVTRLRYYHATVFDGDIDREVQSRFVFVRTNSSYAGLL